MATVATNGRARYDNDIRRLLADQEGHARSGVYVGLPASDGGYPQGPTVSAEVWGMDEPDSRPSPGVGEALRAGLEAVGLAATACFACLDRLVVGAAALAREAFTRVRNSLWVYVLIWAGTVAGILFRLV